jgi:hypothetical protein
LPIDTRLLDACALLLGPSTRRASVAFLQQLDMATVRRAWRVLAVASHPDAVRRNGAGQDARRFIQASRAYELLMGYLLSRPAPRGTSEKRAAADTRATADRPSKSESRGSPLYYRGPVPRRRLRLAEFLYYTGRVSWQSLINAVVWQRRAQPRFGELARELRCISSADLARILGSRLRHEQTGETARRLRILTAAEVERILRLQRARRRLIGRYFVEKESMTSAALGSLLHELHRHNARWGAAGGAE